MASHGLKSAAIVLRTNDATSPAFALLRPVADAASQERVRDLVLQAYAEYEESATQAAS